jgi:3-dehydroquinate dehydratase II
MVIRVLNGPNLNLVGTREPEIYGRMSLADIERMVRVEASHLGVEVDWFQSNDEGALVDRIQESAGQVQGLMINAGAYSHTSLAIRDALLAVRLPFVEVHLSNVFAREPVRHQSAFGDLAIGVITGFGPQSYSLGLRALHGRLANV